MFYKSLRIFLFSVERFLLFKLKQYDKLYLIIKNGKTKLRTILQELFLLENDYLCVKL